MTEYIGSEIDVYTLEFNKQHYRMMLFENMSAMTVCSSPQCVDICLNIKWTSSNW